MTQDILEVLVIEDNPGDALLAEEMLTEDGSGFRVHRAESLLTGLDMLAGPHIDVVLLDLNLPDCVGLETLWAIRAHAPTVPVVLLTGQESEALGLSAVEAGAEDYLVKDHLDADLLGRTLRYAVIRWQARQAAGPQDEVVLGEVIGVVGSKGGVGVTTIVCHMAAELRKQTGEGVLLTDLNRNSNATSFLLDTSSPYTLFDAADNVHRLDGGIWKTIVATTRSDFDLIASDGSIGFAKDPQVGRLAHSMRFLRQHYKWVVLDMGRVDHFALQLAREATRLYLVATDDVLAIHEAGRAERALLESGVEKKSMAIIRNLTGRWPDGEKVLRGVVDLPIDATLPPSRDELHQAFLGGRLLEEPVPFRRALGRLVARLTGRNFQPEPKARPPLRLWPSFARKSPEPSALARLQPKNVEMRLSSTTSPSCSPLPLLPAR